MKKGQGLRRGTIIEIDWVDPIEYSTGVNKNNASKLGLSKGKTIAYFYSWKDGILKVYSTVMEDSRKEYREFLVIPETLITRIDKIE